MGSIPTRSRQPIGAEAPPRGRFRASTLRRLGVASLAALLLAAPPAGAQGPAAGALPDSARPEETAPAQPAPAPPAPATGAGPGASRGLAATPAPRSAPSRVMLRSAVIPGWGQLYNRRYVKAVLAVAGEGYLLYRAYDEFQRERDAVDRLSLALGADDPAAIAEATAERDFRMNRKINFLWWAAAAHLLIAVDAYVDAHLGAIPADVGPPEIGFGPDGRPRAALAIRTRF